MLALKSVREDFPILERTVRGKPLVYLDNAATTQKPRQVVEAISDFYFRSNANVHRSIHTLGEEATHLYVEAHEKVARFLHARGMQEIVFTKNCTEAINTVAYAWGLRRLQPGDEVLITLMEHHSNTVPWQQVCQRTGATLRVAPVTKDGRIDLEETQRLLSRRTKVVAFTGMSNVLGTMTPAKEVVRMAKEVGAVTLLDGAQSVPHSRTDVRDLGCDFLAFSGHKMLGPTGIGVLYGREEMLREMDPFLYGGEMIRRVSIEETTWNDLPWKFEAGTPVVAEAVGLAAAVDYLSAIGMEHVERHERDLVRHAFDRLREVPDLEILGPAPEHRGGVVAFTMGEIHAHDLASLLDEQGVAIRAGHHCAQPLMAHLGIPSAARASFYVYNTREEVEALVKALGHAREVFGL